MAVLVVLALLAGGCTQATSSPTVASAGEHFSTAQLPAPAPPWPPSKVRVQAWSGVGADTAPQSLWLSTSLRDLVGRDGCAVATGRVLGDLMAAVPPDAAYDGGVVELVLSTAEVTPAQLHVRMSVMLPGDEGCPPNSLPEEPLAEPWPAEQRRWATAWARAATHPGPTVTSVQPISRRLRPHTMTPTEAAATVGPRSASSRPRRALALFAACAALAGCSTGGVGTTQTGGSTGSSTSSSSAGAAVEWATAPDQPIVSISFADQTVGGLMGTDLTVLYPDGTLIRSTPDRTGWTTATVAPAALDRLARQLDEADLEHPTDTGDPGITDQGTLSISLSLNTGTVAHGLYAPGETDGLTSGQKQARKSVGDFIGSVRGLDGEDLVEPEQPYQVERMELTATTTVRSTVASDYESAIDGHGHAPSSFADFVNGAGLPGWTGPTSLPDLLSANGCAVVAGGDLAALRELLSENDLGEPLEPGASLVVASGPGRPSALTLTGAALLPHHVGCEAPWSTVDPELAEPQWPMDGPAAVTPWQMWQADEVVLDLAVNDEIGHDANGTSDLTWYDYAYVTGTAEGRQVIDIVADDRSEIGYGERDPSSFAVRLDAATGEVLQVRVDR